MVSTADSERLAPLFLSERVGAGSPNLHLPGAQGLQVLRKAGSGWALSGRPGVFLAHVTGPPACGAIALSLPVEPGRAK